MDAHLQKNQTNFIVIPNTQPHTNGNVGLYNPSTNLEFNILIGNNVDNPTYQIAWDNFQIPLMMVNLEKKETYLIEAVRNFVRKNNFNDLTENLAAEILSEDEFEKELDLNENKYSIRIKNIDNPEDILLIAELVDRIGYGLKEFNVDEVSEMFSIDENQLVSYIRSCKTPLID